MEQFYKFNELTNYPVIIAQLKLSLIVTAYRLVLDSRWCVHSMMNTLLCRRGLHCESCRSPCIARVAVLQLQLIIYSTLHAATSWTNERQRAISDSPALLLSAKADDIVDASSELDGIIVIYLVVSIGFIMSGIWIWIPSHFLTAASMTASVGPTRYIKLDGWDRRRALTICSQFCNVPAAPPVLFRKTPSKSQLWVQLYLLSWTGR